MTEQEVRVKYKKLHDDLSEAYYKEKAFTKEEFDLQHGKIWSDMEAELIVGGFIKPPGPVRDLAAEVDEIKARLGSLETR